MQVGVLKYWCDTRCFGFIEPDDGGPDVFVHIVTFKNAGLVPEKGESFLFKSAMQLDGRLKATRVKAQIERLASIADAAEES
jgi:cold shock CspA family protein